MTQIVNEDRHLTSCLLLAGWKVIFVPDVFTATETPRTLRRWLLQQVRWSRAIHIETFHRPEIYILHSPLFFYVAMRRVVNTFVVPIAMLYFLVSGQYFLGLKLADLAMNVMISLVYVAMRNPYRVSWKAWLWVLPAQILYTVSLPGIALWGAATLLDDAWGTTMRATTEMSARTRLRTKIYELGFFVLWMGIVGGAMGRFLAMNFQVGSPLYPALIFGPTLSIWGLLGWWLVVTKG